MVLIQIYGRKKCFDTKKAQRFFQERGVTVQNVDLDRYGMRPRELESVLCALGSLDCLVNEKHKDYHNSAYPYLRDEQAKRQKLLDCPFLLKSPILRWKNQATVGFCPEQWKEWLQTIPQK